MKKVWKGLELIPVTLDNDSTLLITRPPPRPVAIVFNIRKTWLDGESFYGRLWKLSRCSDESLESIEVRSYCHWFNFVHVTIHYDCETKALPCTSCKILL